MMSKTSKSLLKEVKEVLAHAKKEKTVAKKHKVVVPKNIKLRRQGSKTSLVILDIDKLLIESIDAIAKKKRLTHNQIIHQALIRYVEDFEDLKLARTIAKKAAKTYTLAKVKKELQLT